MTDKFNEFKEMLEDDRVDHFYDLDNDAEASKEYRRLLNAAPTVDDTRIVHDAFNAYHGAPQPSESREMDEDETADFHKELEEAPDMEATKKVLAKYGRLANPSEHGFAEQGV